MRQISCIGVVLLGVSSAWGQTYQAVVLPTAPGHAWTLGTGAGGPYHAGYGAFPGQDFPARARAVLFNAGGFVDVTPPNFNGALINNSDGAQHGGGATPGGGYPAYAHLWVGSEPTNLHPAGYTVSDVLGVGGGAQAGYVIASFYCSECGRYVQKHAGVWRGSAASFTELHSTAHDYTSAWGTDGAQHAGQGSVISSGASRALLWNGESMAIDLHPSGFDRSLAIDVRDGRQVGSASAGDVHAALWTGTAASFVDLNPPAYCQSEARGVRNNVQVGLGSLCSESWRYRALAWAGTPESVTDLHALLPAEFQPWSSGAEDIDGNGNIVGFVEQSGQFRPVIWYRSSPPPWTGSRAGIAVPK
jgi:hypothetical protein